MIKKKIKQPDSSHGLILSIERDNASTKFFYIITYAILIILGLVCFLPPIWIFISAFKDINEFLANPPTIIPRSFNPGKFVEAWKQSNFGRSYLNTIIMGAGNVVSHIICNGLAGYALSRLKPKGWKLIFALLTWSMMMPASVCMVPLFMDFCDFPIFGFNLTDSYIPFWIMSAGGSFTTLLFKSFFDSISLSYLEAARIDGCSEIGIFMRIILPLSKPIMFTVTVFTLNSIWGDFLFPYLILRDENLWTTGVKIYKMQASATKDMQFMVMLFATIPPIVVYLFLQKYMMKGISIGGVKG